MSRDARCFLLVHGLGATGAVWAPVAAALAARGLGRSLAPDLAGHGAAAPLPLYTVGALAAGLAPALAAAGDVTVVGHSLGGYVALALASGWFGVRVRGVLTIGTKLAFSDAERSRAAEFARRPARVYASEAEALERYRKASGLEPAVAPDPAVLARGVAAAGDGYRLAADPAAFGIEVPDFRALLAAAACPVLACRGAGDALVSSAELRAVAAGAIDLPGVGHNLHVEAPELVVGLVERLLAG